jgi:Mn-dependent DtxR family transcriptional regulator
MGDLADMDMARSVQECTERILSLLANRDRVNVLNIAEALGERSVVVYQAIGWLAREGRVRYEQDGNQVYLARIGGTAPGGAAMEEAR